ncbi:nicotinamide-nucleotide adenylyltransferase [Desulfonatronum thiosulfatophilum]|uniref:Nicotinamide-nucleotide adenylyltransferase n=1 Tax=Desulfonatronum thiosulfatophilum TaxID=617002 RepID=A0A1G6DVU3_9BACT|nr:nicotinate-nucleotide adenylyltransferase [Desulfonatronum thiosulfatophilum]SDB49273.1 nicotinamide-nucleotide adenylyltransferase [Desulfonatronum thiosulfatophilum]
MYDMGVIHGRFQVLHNDHMRYLLAGKELCRHLVVGITNPDPSLTGEVQEDRTRSDALANPLSYFERLLLVRDSLLEVGLTYEEMTIVPLPITQPKLFRHYVPFNAVFLLSIYDDWGRRKLDQFRQLSLETHVLWEVRPEEKGISASDVREAMIDGREWEHLVPRPTAVRCRQWDIPGRLRKLRHARR